MKRILSLLLALILCLSVFSACGKSSEDENTSDKKILRTGDLFANGYTSLDAQKEDYGWYTGALGLTETLFRIDESYTVVPWLAEGGTLDGNTWTITLRDDVTFSDGTKLTAEIAAQNIERSAAVNEKASAFAEAKYEIIDEFTFTITTPEPMPILLNELCNVHTSIINIDGSEDIDNAPVCTGPFKVESFDPGVSISLVRNENYWDGEVVLDGVECKYVADADTLSLAFQNKEIDAFIGPTSNDLEIFAASPDEYKVVSTPASRLYYYYLNMERLPDEELRAAINMAFDSEAVCSLLAGLASPTVGAYGIDTAYGNVEKHGYDPEKAKELIESLGYTLNADGYYEKDGEIIELQIDYYAARSIDKIVLLMQEQLKDIGIKSTLNVTEDPDGTYITTGDFDIGLYCMIANPSADPYYFLNRVAGGGLYTSGGYENEDVTALLTSLYSEADAEKRSEIAIDIQQQILDDEAMGFLALLNKITAMHSGVSNCNENNPISFYFIDANTDISK